MRILRFLMPFLVVCCAGYAQSSPSSQSATAQAVDARPDLALPSSVYVKVQLENSVKVPALKPGNVIEGRLAQDVYSGDRELFSAGSRVCLTVDKLERRRRIPNDHWPWVVKAFTPRHENYPTFRSATVILPGGKEVPLSVSLLFINRETQVRARAKTKKAAQPAARAATQPADTSAGPVPLPARTESKDAGPAASTKKPLGPVVTLEAANPFVTSGEALANSALPGSVTLAAGTGAKVILLGGVSASKSRPGDALQARLVEPVRLDSKVVLPEGTLLTGRVVSRTPPRMLSRAGSLLLVFTDLTLPWGDIPVVASVTGAELDQRSHTRIDPEGKLRGDRPGKVWMAINVGVTGGVAKEADDTIQLIIEAVASTATDASTAGVARIIATCASGLFLITRHGRDVLLPRFTEMNIVFDRPLSMAGSQPASSVP